MASGTTGIDTTAAGPYPARLPAIHRAGRVAAAAGALGLAGQLLFFGVGLGINFPVAMTLLLGGGWALRRPVHIDARDVWLAPASVAFAAFAAIRADPTMGALDVLTSLGLAAAALSSFGGRAVLSRSFGAIIGLGLAAIGWIVGGAVAALAGAGRNLPSTGSMARRIAPAAPVLRGLAIALPVLLVFVALFSAADAVFAELMDDLFTVDADLGEVAWRLALAAVLAWLAGGGLALAASTPSAPADAVGRGGWRVGSTEVTTVLLAVCALFALFVALQAAYLFGGLDTMQAAGLTYAEYARRGFFELVTVAVLAGGLIVVGERCARGRPRALIAAALALTLLTGVVLVSAALRLRLYQEAYGWTELRLYVLATIVLLAIGVVGLVAALATDRVRWMGHVLVVSALAVGLVLNVLGPVRFITEQNVARVLEPELVPPNGSSGLDETYAASLGDDAIPALVTALPALPEPGATYLGVELGYRLEALRHEAGLGAWQAWNLGRESARHALEAAVSKDALPRRP